MLKRSFIGSVVGHIAVVLGILAWSQSAWAVRAGATDYYQTTNLPQYSYDPTPEMGWDVAENPNDPLVQRLTPYYQNDTRDIKHWQVIIKAWEYDPPNAILLRVVDQRPLLTSSSKIDVRVEAGYYDDTNNLMVETRQEFYDIDIKPGENLFSLPFHNDRTHVIHARVIKVRNVTPIMAID